MIPIRVVFDPPQVGEPDPTAHPRKEPQMRRMKITESVLQKYGYTEGCEGFRAKAAGMTQKHHGETCRKRIEQALDGDEAGRELRRKNTERENQRIAEKMERDPGKTGDEPMAQEPEEVEAPAASSGGGQEEKMQEEETAVMRPMEDEETEAKRPRVEDEPKNSVNSDTDMDEEMQSWNFMSMVKGYDFRRAKDRQRFMRELGERQPDAVIGGASRSTPDVVMNFMNKAYKMQADEERFFVHVQDRFGMMCLVLPWTRRKSDGRCSKVWRTIP